jgi:hypothetical protein
LQTGHFGATVALPFEIDRAISQTLDVTISAPGLESAPSRPPALLDEVDRPPPAAAVPNPDAVAVVIGIERYALLPPARFAARDAHAFQRYATTTLGVNAHRGRAYLRIDGDATGGEFRKIFADDGWLARRVTPASDVYVFFSGHGATDPTTRAPYLLPADADAAYTRETGYALATLYQQLARLDARSVTVFLDASFTGSAGGGQSTATGDGRPIVISVEHPALLRDGFAVFGAAASDQFAADDVEKRYGLFTYFALLGLRGHADADGDAIVTVGELERFLEDRVPAGAAALDREQTPIVTAREKDAPVVRLRRPR